MRQPHAMPTRRAAIKNPIICADDNNPYIAISANHAMPVALGQNASPKLAGGNRCQRGGLLPRRALTTGQPVRLEKILSQRPMFLSPINSNPSDGTDYARLL